MSSISSSAVGIWDSIQNIPKRLYTVLLMKSFLTTLYSTLRIYLIGDLPDASGVNIASQAMWLNLLFEILQEGLIRPLYNSIGSTVNDLDETLNKLKTGFLLVAGVFSVFSIPLWIFTRQIIELMSANAVSVDFIRLELISNILISLNMFLEIILQLKFSNKILLLGLFTRLIFTIIFDIFFLSQFSVSLKLGVNGVAYSNIGTQLLTLFVLGTGLCVQLKASRMRLQGGWNWSWFIGWGKQGFFSAGDSFIRNIVYILVILRSMNALSQAGVYWVTNSFIWTWLLLPFYPLSEVLRIQISSRPREKLLDALKGYIALSTGIVLLWACTVPAWNWFFSVVYNSDQSELNVKLAGILVPFYSVFLFNELTASVLLAHGRLDLLFIAAVIGNTVIGATFIAVEYELIPLVLENVAIIFGSGLVLGFIVKFILLCVWISRYADPSACADKSADPAASTDRSPDLSATFSNSAFSDQISDQITATEMKFVF